MGHIRVLIESFLRGRIGYEGPRAFGLLVGLLLVGALALAVLRSTGPVLGLAALGIGLLLALSPRRGLRLLAAPVLIGAIVVVGWLLVGPLLTIPRFSSGGPVVRNGVAVIVACGKKQGIEGMDAAMKYVPEPRTGGWWPEKQGECTVWYHRPPGPEQRSNRQERAAHPPASGEMPPQPEGAVGESQFERLPVVEKLPADER